MFDISSISSQEGSKLEKLVVAAQINCQPQQIYISSDSDSAEEYASNPSKPFKARTQESDFGISNANI
jgi:hypothetical protein